MTAKRLAIAVLTAAVAVFAPALALAQDDGVSTETPPPATTPSRPVLLPLTPGASTATPATSATSQTPPKAQRPAAPRSRVISVPGAAATTPAAAAPQPESRRNADSDYTFCNRTSYAISIAVGIRQGGIWATRGWWILPSGECRVVIKGTLTQPAYYSFARSSFAHTGPIRIWGGNQVLCTGKGQFQATSDGSDQCGPGLEPQGFAKVETEGKTAWTTTLTEAPGFKTLESARIAGLERLLSDIGRYAGPIDGVASPKFSEALALTRTALQIPQSDDIASIYNKLLAEAAKGQATAGLTFCNRTQDIVWSALGRETQGKRISQGWWRLQPGQCEKVIKDKLIERFVYAFASGEKSEGANQTWGGAFPFCTRASLFEIEGADDCPGRGFESTGFLQIDTGGRPGLTFEFAPRREEGAPTP